MVVYIHGWPLAVLDDGKVQHPSAVSSTDFRLGCHAAKNHLAWRSPAAPRLNANYCPRPPNSDQMARVLITSGPTRQYLDPVRYLSNASSGRMGKALAEAALRLGNEVVIVSGPVTVQYPEQAEVHEVVSTEEMLETCGRLFPACDGLIGAAAPCDYRPVQVQPGKITKTGEPLALHLIETPDVVATMGAQKRPGQWVVGFALETEDRHLRAVVKLEKKSCELMVLNGPEAINSPDNQVQIIDPAGAVLRSLGGSKQDVAQGILEEIQTRLIAPATVGSPSRD